MCELFITISAKNTTKNIVRELNSEVVELNSEVNEQNSEVVELNGADSELNSEDNELNSADFELNSEDGELNSARIAEICKVHAGKCEVNPRPRSCAEAVGR